MGKLKKGAIVAIVLGSVAGLIGVLGLTAGGIFLGARIASTSRQNTDPEHIDPPVEGNKLVFANNRSLYDKNGNLLRLKGVNAGNLLVTEGWISPYSCGAELNDDGTPHTDRDGNVTYPELNQEETLEGFASNPNLTDAQREELWDIYRKHWFSDADFTRIKEEFNMNAIRLPFYWRNILNENADGTYSRKSEAEAFTYLDHFVEQCGKNNVYCILDLHGAVKTQNGYEHSGSESEEMLWDDEVAIAATADLWKYVAEHYKDNELGEYIATYDLLNEPCGNYHGATQDNCYPVFNRLYQAIRETGDNHVITIEGCWTYDKFINPSKYNWQNIQYEIHMYNWSNSGRTDQQYFDQMELTRIGHDWNVPYYVGEFTCFGDDYEVWDRWLSFFDRLGYSWTLWTYKKVVVGWWNDNWGLYNYRLYLNNQTHEQKLDLRNATYAELKKCFEEGNTTNCYITTSAKHIQKYMGVNIILPS